MKQALTIFFLLVFRGSVYAQNEIGPEGHKLLWLAGIILLAGIVILFMWRPDKEKKRIKLSFLKRQKIKVQLLKDRLYIPGHLELTITNTGNTDVDINPPLLIFSGLWYNRKFKLKGTNNTSFYPLYLMKGQSHTLNIDLNRFYGFDKTLKRLPRAKIVVSNVKGKSVGSGKVLLRKTLFNI